MDRNVPKDLDIHMGVDNYRTDKHAGHRRCLAARPRFHVHYTPTYASWVNKVEICFNIVTHPAIRRDTFRTVRQLAEGIKRFVEHHNLNSKPFVRTATVDSILARIARLCKATAGTVDYMR